MKFENPAPQSEGSKHHENPRRQVDVMHYDPETRSSKVVASCILENGKVRIEGEDKRLRSWLQAGVYSPAEHREVTPEDGEAYLQALGQEFKSTQMFATKPRDLDEPEVVGT